MLIQFTVENHRSIKNSANWKLVLQEWTLVLQTA